jgi:hypothetical protein
VTSFNSARTLKLDRFAPMLLPALVLISLSGNGGAAQPDERLSESTRIEGTWILQATNIADPKTSFTALASFAEGGVFLATGSTNHANHPFPTSPLYGAWKKNGHNQYVSTTLFFGFDVITGEANAMVKLLQTFKLTGHDGIVGTDEFYVCDVQGQQCQRVPPGDNAYTGTRVIPEDAGHALWH